MKENQAWLDMVENLPVGETTRQHWAKQNPKLLQAAAVIIEIFGANPWVFVSDERHFEQFADEKDREALVHMDVEIQDAFLDW